MEARGASDGLHALRCRVGLPRGDRVVEFWKSSEGAALGWQGRRVWAQQTPQLTGLNAHWQADFLGLCMSRTLTVTMAGGVATTLGQGGTAPADCP